MLSKAKIVAFIPATDFEQARQFYVGKLGLEFVSLDQFALVLKTDEHHVRITKMPDFKPLPGTIFGWEVRGIEAVVRWLAQQGIAVEKYPFAQDQELGIWTTPNGDKVAWFEDPSGNVISVSEHVS